MDAQTMRAVDIRASILPSTSIPLCGCGKATITKRVPGGGIVTLEADRIYRLECCGCLISSAEELWDTCAHCRAELEQASLLDIGGVPACDLDWLCKPCKRHGRDCSFPGCGQRGCQRHFIDLAAVEKDMNGEGSRYFCPGHLVQVRQALEIERRGRVVVSIGKFLRSLFFDDDEVVR